MNVGLVDVDANAHRITYQHTCLAFFYFTPGQYLRKIRAREISRCQSDAQSIFFCLPSVIADHHLRLCI
ncbi:hypothetical protein L1987_06752 [Smallanthus sonchifolius]|uniref:Uncharacterized protein n=1 Tax=Smallanthus sonchifolius TaxID=185202 RepID=A0ACB9JYZ2_9ASTR|nr:hypothetical protein L1987_06752 [Smallanthus sonchifolius]